MSVTRITSFSPHSEMPATHFTPGKTAAHSAVSYRGVHVVRVEHDV